MKEFIVTNETMNEKLSALFNRVKADSNLLTVSEAQTSQGIVLPILNNLGWDVFDTTEVTPEYSVGGRRVDFALRIQSINKVFLEIKKTSENLENHQEQLVYYAFQQGVKLAILTNGITWQFYLPLEEGNWEQRRFFTIDLMEQSVDDAIEKFEGLLSRTNVDSGNAYQTAKSLYEGRQKNKIIKENLPKAWQKLISEPDEMLVELLNETLEKISGYKAENGQITEFLQQIFPNLKVNLINTKPHKIIANEVKSKQPDSVKNSGKQFEFDTIVVPAQEEGFLTQFITNKCWFAIRIGSAMIPKIKYIAAYQVAPISAITHIAEVSKIERYENTDKYILYFKNEPEKVKEVKLGKYLGKVPQAPRYSSRDQILNAKSLDDLF